MGPGDQVLAGSRAAGVAGPAQQGCVETDFCWFQVPLPGSTGSGGGAAGGSGFPPPSSASLVLAVIGRGHDVIA